MVTKSGKSFSGSKTLIIGKLPSSGLWKKENMRIFPYFLICYKPKLATRSQNDDTFSCALPENQLRRFSFVDQLLLFYSNLRKLTGSKI
jgi:hypothetical protein